MIEFSGRIGLMSVERELSKFELIGCILRKWTGKLPQNNSSVVTTLVTNV